MAIATNIPLPPEVAHPPQPPARDAKEFQRRMGSISRHSAVYFAGTILTAAAGYFFKIYLARTLGAEALGLYALGMTMVGFLSLFNAFGLPTAAARFVAAYAARGDFWQLGGFLRGSLALLSACNLLLALLVLAAGPWVAVHFYHAPALNSYLGAFALIMLFGVLNNFLGQVMAGYHDVARRTLITHFIGTPANILIAVVLISLGLSLTGYLAAQVASAVLVLALLGVSVWKMTPPQARSHGPFVRIEPQVVTFSAAASGIAVLEFVLGQADKMVLGFYLDVKQVGIYAVAMALVGFVPIALQSVNQIFSPAIAELHAAGNHALLQQLYATLTKWILIFTFPLALTMVVFSHSLMGIFGASFAPGAAVLAIGAVGQFFNCAVGSVGHLLLMSGNQLQLVKVQALNAVMMIALSLVLVPRWGVNGAAIAAALTVVSSNVCLLGVVHRRLRLFPYHGGYFNLVVPALLSSGILLLLARASIGMHSQWKMAAGGLLCAYGLFLGLISINGLDNSDRIFVHLLRAKLFGNSQTDKVGA
jgi:O-antigen/teichoic acid export membrane protein